MRLSDRLLSLLRHVAAIGDPLMRARVAHRVSGVLREFDRDLINVRDAAIREDRDGPHPHTVEQVAAATEIGVHTVVNARRISKARKIVHVGKGLVT